MTTDQLEGFLIVEDLEAPTPPDAGTQVPVLPGGKRRPIDPGYILTWKEFARDVSPLDREGHTVRTGMVLAPAPRPGTVWAVPDQEAPGEGYAVIVGQVTADSADNAIRVVGSVGDHRSTDGWQRPRTLPRAVLRVDRYTILGGGDYHVALLHADPACQHMPPFEGEDVFRGVPEPVEECYVFAGRLHPWSRRPTVPETRPGAGGLTRHVNPCRVCLPGEGRQRARRSERQI